jgi:hypothetical protein
LCRGGFFHVRPAWRRSCESRRKQFNFPKRDIILPHGAELPELQRRCAPDGTNWIATSLRSSQ